MHLWIYRVSFLVFFSNFSFILSPHRHHRSERAPVASSDLGWCLYGHTFQRLVQAILTTSRDRWRRWGPIHDIILFQVYLMMPYLVTRSFLSPGTKSVKHAELAKFLVKVRSLCSAGTLARWIIADWRRRRVLESCRLHRYRCWSFFRANGYLTTFGDWESLQLCHRVQ